MVSSPRCLVPSTISGSRWSDALQAEQLEHARVVGAGAPVAECPRRCRGIRRALAGAEEIDAILGRKCGRRPVQHSGAMLGQPGERRALPRWIEGAAGYLADLARCAVLSPTRDQGLGALVVRQQRWRHGIAVVVDQPSAAGSSRDRERGGTRSQVRHHLAQLTERGRSGPPDFADILLDAPAGKRPPGSLPPRRRARALDHRAQRPPHRCSTGRRRARSGDRWAEPPPLHGAWVRAPDRTMSALPSR
jgi:hypothetical protein